MSPRLTELIVGDAPDAWAAAGFDVVPISGGRTGVQIAHVTIVLAGADAPTRGVAAWAFDRETADILDGVLTLEADEAPSRSDAHPNGVDRFDHVVMMSPDGPRTLAALRAVGFEPRRTRDFERGGQALQQTFLWMGDVILELANPAEPSGTGPATLWGLALVVDDLDATASGLGELCSEPRTAVQPGRRIASLRHKDLNITVPIAFMTPHVRPGEAG